jgi:hypothetical protein
MADPIVRPNCYAEDGTCPGYMALSLAAGEMQRALSKLITDCCPINWADDECGPDAWREASRLSGTALPDRY